MTERELVSFKKPKSLIQKEWSREVDKYKNDIPYILHTEISKYNDEVKYWYSISLRWRHNGRGGVSNHMSRDYLLNCLLRRRSMKTSKFCVTGLCVGNSPVTSEFPAQMANNAENVSIWWRHHVYSTQQEGRIRRPVPYQSNC